VSCFPVEVKGPVSGTCSPIFMVGCANQGTILSRGAVKPNTTLRAIVMVKAQARFESTFGAKRSAELRELLRAVVASELGPQVPSSQSLR
jgi:hypothetical protein